MISAGAATVLSRPMAAAAAGVSVIDFWPRETMTPPARQLRLVVVLPARTRQREKPLPLGHRCGRIRIGIDEDVAVVEGGDQPRLIRQQHAVAEHVARHVAHADGGEGRRLDVAVELAEMPLHRFPGALGGDAHLLVVVAGRTARREGVVEPEIEFLADRVGRVGECRGALVGGNDEVGIVLIAAHHVLRAGRHRRRRCCR